MAEGNISEALTAAHYVTCPCQYCSSHIEFDASDFGPSETRAVECPHCHMETIIFVPRTPPKAEAWNPANLPQPRAVPPVIAVPVLQDNRAKLRSFQSKVNFADLIWAVGMAGCLGCPFLAVIALIDPELAGFLRLAVLGVATGIPVALYGHARAKQLRRELTRLQLKAHEEQAMLDAALAREEAAQVAAYSASPEYFAKCLAVLHLNEKTTPSTAEGFIGQARVKAEVYGAYQEAITSGKRPPHILLVGSQGMGTPTLALLFARAFSKASGATYRVAGAQDFPKSGDFAGCLSNLKEGDVLFLKNIDEFTFGPLLKSAMVDFTLDIVIDEGPNARSVRLNLPHFLLIATATKTEELSPLLVASFPVVARLEGYSTGEITAITRKLARDLGIKMDEATIHFISSFANCPGVISFLLELVRVYAQARQYSESITLDMAREALKALPASQESIQRREVIPSEVRREVWRRDGGRCVQCGSQERLEYDHIIPVSKGGSSTARNLQLLCETCNRAKSDSIQ